MDPKIAILFLLIGTIVGLSHLGQGGLARTPRLFARRRWREIMPSRRKS
jgi:hypothetical protein